MRSHKESGNKRKRMSVGICLLRLQRSGLSISDWLAGVSQRAPDALRNTTGTLSEP
jgi:hypothetical protein